MSQGETNSQIKMDNFLTPGIEQIRQSIIDIDDSYNNDWDVLAELCQNAVDSIRKSDRAEGLIKIKINCSEKTIKIFDNGVGINPDKLPYLLKPFSTNKRQDHDLIGEKGVGLTFVMFSSNYFEIKSGNEEGAAIGVLNNAYDWKNSEDDEYIDLKVDKIDEELHGTEVYIKNVKETYIFELTFEQIKFVLRTRTALGSTKSIWGDDRNINIEIEFTDLNGKKYIDTLPFQYKLIFETLPQSAKIDYDDFLEYSSQADRSDSDKRNILRDKVIFRTDEYIHGNNRKIKYVACFVPKRHIWNKMSLEEGLCSEEDLDNDEWLENFDYVKYKSGIFSSVKGMPTGIITDHPSSGWAGYWSNLFILLEDPQLSFDIGRKSLHGSQAKILRDVSKKIFDGFTNNIVKYISGEPETNIEWDRDETFDEINNMLDLNISDIKFKKNPKDQEASVSAIFFECIGNGKINQITPLLAGYRSKYDLYAKWGSKKIVIEFKSKLRNIIKDFSDAQKLFNEIDCIVCWDVSDEDREKLRIKLGIDVEQIEENILSGRTQTIPNSTHKLLLSGLVKPIYVIDIKKILDTE